MDTPTILHAVQITAANVTDLLAAISIFEEAKDNEEYIGRWWL